jgi:hypothetical protein
MAYAPLRYGFLVNGRSDFWVDARWLTPRYATGFWMGAIPYGIAALHAFLVDGRSHFLWVGDGLRPATLRVFGECAMAYAPLRYDLIPINL